MKIYLSLIWVAIVIIAGACSVMTPALEKSATGQPPFDQLLARPDRYLGQSVILGGYVLEVHNQPERTRLIVVQAPLGTGREPKSQDLSQGRIIATVKGFLDPEVYAKGRKITLGGEVSGGSGVDPQPEPFPYVSLEATEIYLWPRPAPISDPYWWPYGYDPWWGFYPYPWYGYPPRVKHRR